MDFKKVTLILVSSFALANPTSIHYSALGNYLVDQNGCKTHITGHPKIVCYTYRNTIKGRFVKQQGRSIFVKTQSEIVKIDKPVCDILSE